MPPGCRDGDKKLVGTGWNRLWRDGLFAVPLESADPSPLRSPPAFSVGAGPVAGPGILSRHRAWRLGPRPGAPLGSPTSPQNVTTGRSSGDNRDSVSRVRAWEELWSVWSPVPPFSLEGPFLLSFPNVSVP